MTAEHEDEAGYAEGWRPKAGDRVVGTVIDIAATDGGYGVYPIVTLKTANGEIVIHAFHTVLRRELARRRPVVGDDLDITYLGKQKGKAGTNGYDGYRVRSSKDVVGYNWDLELQGDEAAMAAASIPIESAPISQPEPVAAAKVAEDDDLPF